MAVHVDVYTTTSSSSAAAAAAPRYELRPSYFHLLRLLQHEYGSMAQLDRMLAELVRTTRGAPEWDVILTELKRCHPAEFRQLMQWRRHDHAQQPPHVVALTLACVCAAKPSLLPPLAPFQLLTRPLPPALVVALADRRDDCPCWPGTVFDFVRYVQGVASQRLMTPSLMWVVLDEAYALHADRTLPYINEVLMPLHTRYAIRVDWTTTALLAIRYRQYPLLRKVLEEHRHECDWPELQRAWLAAVPTTDILRYALNVTTPPPPGVERDMRSDDPHSQLRRHTECIRTIHRAHFRSIKPQQGRQYVGYQRRAVSAPPASTRRRPYQ